MDDLSRRGLLTGAAVILAANAGCQGLFDAESESTEDGEAVKVSGVGGTVSSIYITPTSAGLPTGPDEPAFGITGEGIFQFEGGNGWHQINYGTLQNPVPSVTAAQMAVGHSPSTRPLVSNGNKTIYVDPRNGDDSAEGTEDAPLKTIQSAVERVPIYLRDQYTIDLATVPDLPVEYDEDVLVPAVIGTGQAGKEGGAPEAGPVQNLLIEGSESNKGAVKIGSIMFGNLSGTSACLLSSVTLTRDSPYDDEKNALAAYGSGEIQLYDITITDGATNGILAYGADMYATIIDLGQQSVASGIRAKRHASIIARQVTGTTAGPTFNATLSSRITIGERTEATGNPTYRARYGSTIYDAGSDSWVGMTASSESSNSVTNTARTAHPEDATPGDIWYVDGSGDVDEGFYGQTNQGPTKLQGSTKRQ